MGTGNLSVWVGTGLLTAGLSAAVLAGPAVAVAQTGAGSESSSDSASAPGDTQPDPAKSLAENGLTHKDVIRFRTPGLHGLNGSCN